MQNVSFKDMYNLSLHQTKYNGHLQVSHSSRASKKDRKGCKKGKIETILKNKMVNACNRLAQPIGVNNALNNSSSTSSAIKKVLSYNTVPKNNVIKHDPDDPYTFTDLEPTYHNAAGGNVPGPPVANAAIKKEPQPQILKNILPSPRNINIGQPTQVIKKETLPPPSLSLQTERLQNIPPLAAPFPPTSTPTPTSPSPPIFKKPNQVIPLSELKPPPKRRKSMSGGVSTGSTPKPIKAQVKQEKPSDTSCSKLSKSKDKSVSSESANVFSMKLTLPPKLCSKQRRKWKKVGGTGVKHETLQRIEAAVHEYDDVHADLHSLGVDLSDTEEEEEEPMNSNHSNICNTISSNTSSSNTINSSNTSSSNIRNNKSSNGSCSNLYQRQWLSNTIDYMQREEKILQLKNELHRRLGQVIQTINIEKKTDDMQRPLQQSLLHAARHLPSHTALVLDPQLFKTHNKGMRCSKVLLRKRRCQVSGCEKVSLPCTTFCTIHILSNPHQTLFCPCAAVTPTQAVCPQPALPIYSHAAVCCTHKAMLGDQQQKASTTQTPTSSSSVPPSSSFLTPATPAPTPSPSSSRKSRSKKPTTPSPGTKPPPSPRSRKKKPPAAPSLPRGLPAVVNHTLAPPPPTNTSRNNPSGTSSNAVTTPSPSLGRLPIASNMNSSSHTNTRQCTLPSIPPPLYTLHHGSVPSSSSPMMSGNTHTQLMDTNNSVVPVVHHFDDLGNDEQVSEAVLAIASMDPEELANRASRLLAEHDNLSVDEFSDLFSVEEVSEEVLSIAAQDPAELSNQASRLLEHEDLATVLNHLPPDAFDIFSEDKVGSSVYEPSSREEAELQRALAGGASAVDRFITFLDDSDPNTTLLFSGPPPPYPPNGGFEMRHS
uniref:KANL2-like probable zinc-finger domain-containing protein n=1 Tax=Cacopsylla melanoneura TaxID=428564 RepID=A0A8D8YZL3_9HEMI